MVHCLIALIIFAYELCNFPQGKFSLRSEKFALLVYPDNMQSWSVGATKWERVCVWFFWQRLSLSMPVSHCPQVFGNQYWAISVEFELRRCCGAAVLHFPELRSFRKRWKKKVPKQRVRVLRAEKHQAWSSYRKAHWQDAKCPVWKFYRWATWVDKGLSNRTRRCASYYWFKMDAWLIQMALIFCSLVWPQSPNNDENRTQPRSIDANDIGYSVLLTLCNAGIDRHLFF